MTRILAIDTSSAWCSVALSIDDERPAFLHQKVSAGASQLLLPWIEQLLNAAKINLSSLDAIAIGVGPGAFTGVRLGLASVQGLAVATKLPVLPVISLDAIAAELIKAPAFLTARPKRFLVAIDARMNEVYWAHYETTHSGLPVRLGEVALTSPESIVLDDIEFVAGSAINEYGDRLFARSKNVFLKTQLDPEIGVSALGVLACAKLSWCAGLAQDIHQLEPVYVRNKVAFTAEERKQANI